MTEEIALAQAEEAEVEIAAGRYRGPLHGVPIALKDLCWTKGIPTAAGMAILADHRPTDDATVVVRLREAGAVLLGKLQLTEGPYSDHHPSITPPKNPWMPGGFSREGLPIGFQLVATSLAEAMLVRAGAAFQQVKSWNRRHPPSA